MTCTNWSSEPRPIRLSTEDFHARPPQVWRRRLSKNRPGVRIVAWLGKAALKTHALQTLRDSRASPNRAKRLECVRFIGAFLLARDGQRFMVPMHGTKVLVAFHESGSTPTPSPAVNFRLVVKQDRRCDRRTTRRRSRAGRSACRRRSWR